MTSSCKWPIGTWKVLCPIALWDCLVKTVPSFLRNFLIANKRSESEQSPEHQSAIWHKTDVYSGLTKKTPHYFRHLETFFRTLILSFTCQEITKTHREYRALAGISSFQKRLPVPGVNHFTGNCFRMVGIVSKNTFFNSDRLPLFYYDPLTCVLFTRRDKAASV